jgi:ATP-binding cassette, subfamily B, bacterial
MGRVMSGIAGVQSLLKDASVVKKKVKPGTTGRVLRFARPFAGLLGLYLVVVCLDAVAVVIPPLLYRGLVNDGILKGDSAIVIELALLAAFIFLVDAGLGVAQSYLAAVIGNRVVLSVRTALFDHIQRMPLAFFVRAQTGALVSRLHGDVSGAQSAFTDVLSSVIGNVIVAALMLGAMTMLSWQITLVALLLVPVFVLPARSIGRKLAALSRESMDLIGLMNNTMQERFNVAGAQLSKLYGRPEDETALFRRRAAAVADKDIRRAQVQRYFLLSLTLVASLATTVAYGWGGVLTVRHALDLGTLVALISYLGRLYIPITGLSNVQVTVMTALVSFERVFELLDLVPAIREKPDAKPLPEGPARIEFSHVSFRYPAADEVAPASLRTIVAPERQPPESTVLRDLDFRIAPGTLTALVGPSGAGKTTITQLVPRLYDVQGGAVTINGMDVRDATFASLRDRIGVVAQDAHLFHDTIRANLQFAKPDASEAELEDALRAAQIWPLLASLPEGLETLVGERGYRFSGGEKQRLSIARLLLKAPDIVILDEATAHLDSESEAAIQKAFDVALAGRTAIVIAHRLSTILKADQILVIQSGDIVERGAHADLLAQQGLYADLYRRQFLAMPELRRQSP